MNRLTFLPDPRWIQVAKVPGCDLCLLRTRENSPWLSFALDFRRQCKLLSNEPAQWRFEIERYPTFQGMGNHACHPLPPHSLELPAWALDWMGASVALSEEEL